MVLGIGLHKTHRIGTRLICPISVQEIIRSPQVLVWYGKERRTTSAKATQTSLLSLKTTMEQDVVMMQVTPTYPSADCTKVTCIMLAMIFTHMYRITVMF